MADNEPLVETVVIDGDDEPLRRKLEGMASWMQSWGKKIGAIGAGIGALGGTAQAALSKAANDLANYSAGLDKQIRQHNVSAEALGAMKLQADQTGGSLDEMLKNGTRATAEFQTAAEKLGVTMSGENVAAGVALSRALGLVKEQMRFLWMNIGAAVAPAMRQMAQITSTVIAAAIKWVKENQPLIQTISKIASIAVAVGGALTGLGAAMWGIGAAVGWLVPVVTTLGGAFVTFLVSPMGMIAAGIAAGVSALLYFSGAARQMAGGFAVNVGGMLAAAKTILGQITQFFGQTFSGIKQALAGGDMALAAEIAWAAVKMVWFKGASSLVQIVADVLGGDWLTSAMDGIGNAWTYLESGFHTAIAAIQNAWDALMTYMANVADETVALIVNKLIAAYMGIQKIVTMIPGGSKLIGKSADTIQGEYDLAKTIMGGNSKGRIADRNIELSDRQAARTAEANKTKLDTSGRGAAIADRGKEIADAGRMSVEQFGAGLRDGLRQATDEWRAGLGNAAALPGMLPGGVPAAGAEAATASKVKDSVVGTFSAAAAGQLGGGVGATVQQQLVTQRQQLQTQRQMVTLLQRNGGLVAT